MGASVPYTKERAGKIFLYAISDIIFVEFSFIAAITLWYSGNIPGATVSYNGIPNEIWLWFRYMAFVAPIVSIIVYSTFHMYNNLWKYASIDEMLRIFIATVTIFVILFLYDYFFLRNKHYILLPRRLLFTAWMFNTILFAFSRFGYRAIRRVFVFFGHILSSKAGCKRVMVVGAGFSGYGVVRSMLNSQIRDKLPTIIVDSDMSKNNTHIMGVRVLSGIERIQELVEKFQIDEIIIAIPTASNKELKEVMEQCAKTDCSLKIMPPISDVSGGGYVPNIRDVSISDLLYREEIKLDTKNISSYLSNRRILVTGGGGSIGSELCRQIARFNPEQIIIVDIYENDAYELSYELDAKYKGELNLIIRIGSVRDMNRMEEIFREFRPHVVFHTAAHKHVSLIEGSPGEAVKNNICGTHNVVKCADKYKAERFVLLSTDKAVNPTNVYGATKRITELLVQSMAEKSETKFMTVRFGNVLGSKGSIIPLFKQQITNGGPVTVHRGTERYFMTIPEACQLVLQASSLGKTGRIFVLDMGERVNIEDLARKLIKLSGLRPDKDIEIVYTGLRPGDKMREELMLDQEKEDMQLTCHKKIYVTKPAEIDVIKFESQLRVLYNLAEKHPEQVEDYLRKMEPTFRKDIQESYLQAD